MTETAKVFLRESVESHVRQHRAAAERLRRSYKSGPLFEACQQLAQAHDAAAEVFLGLWSKVE